MVSVLTTFKQRHIDVPCTTGWECSQDPAGNSLCVLRSSQIAKQRKQIKKKTIQKQFASSRSL